ncbi:MAG: hypothetical protein JXA24_07745 [Proteobacteria bacterium]|nr:hypothetical protein [Pseudomonadota bacterium]
MYISITMKKLSILRAAAIAAVVMISAEAAAQVGFNPEYLGNAAGAPRPGFCLKFFTSYFYQNGISAHDVETAFEPQVFIPGFSGDIKRDQIQFIAHLPVGYRRERTAAGTVESVTGIGTLTVNVEHFWHLIDEEDVQFWFDNAITSGFPTATDHQGGSAGGTLAPFTRIGGNSFSIGWFTESFLRYKKWLLSINPVAVVWAFEDDQTNSRDGLNISVMNGSAGYQFWRKVALGVDFGMQLGRVAGSYDGTGAGTPYVLRAYAGPAATINLPRDSSLQIAGVIDFATKRESKGFGIFTALWHQF